MVPTKKKSKFLYIAIFLLFIFCINELLAGIEITGEGLYFRFSQLIVTLGIFAFIIYVEDLYSKVTNQKRKENNNYVVAFPRKPQPSWTTFDSTLADLVYDYGLNDEAVMQLIENAVHDACWQYRRDHPLDNPDSYHLFETIFPYD